MISSFKGQAPFNSLYKYAGLRLANKFKDFLIFNKPASGLNEGSNLYQGDVVVSPPIDPNKTASLSFAISIASSLKGVPQTSIEQPPIKI